MTSNYKAVPIMEGPTLIKEDGVYYLFYSANHYRNIDYAVGYATAPTPYGPWTKSANNPIIHRNSVGDIGTGHGDLFWDLKQKPYYIYHGQPGIGKKICTSPMKLHLQMVAQNLP